MVFEYATKIFSLGNNLRQKIRLGEKASNTTIRIGIADVLPRELVFSLINPLMADGLNIFLQCHDDETHALLGKLALGELDIVISDVPVNPFIKVKSYNHIIGESPVTFIGSYQLVARFKPGFPESLAKAPFLMPMKGTSLRQILDNWFDENNIIPNIVAELADIDLFEDFGKSGKGFFALPHVATTGILKNQNLKILGKALGAKESFFIISPEKILKNEIALLILKNAKASMFNQVA
ncbi:MAG: LysR substrate-binding domain-containing protein [Gemmataceae bacterium]